MNELPPCPPRVQHLLSEKHVSTIDDNTNKDEMYNLKENISKEKLIPTAEILIKCLTLKWNLNFEEQHFHQEKRRTNLSS